MAFRGEDSPPKKGAKHREAVWRSLQLSVAAVGIEAADRSPKPLHRPPVLPNAPQAAPPVAYSTAVARQRAASRRYLTADSPLGSGGRRERKEIKSDLNKIENE